MNRSTPGEEIQVGRQAVRITRPQKLLFPEDDIDKPHHPDQMIFDLDPSGDDFRAVCRAALTLRQLLEREQLHAFVKTTGSRGLHVLVPLNRRADFDEVRAFARGIATQLVDSEGRPLWKDLGRQAQTLVRKRIH